MNIALLSGYDVTNGKLCQIVPNGAHPPDSSVVARCHGL